MEFPSPLLYDSRDTPMSDETTPRDESSSREEKPAPRRPDRFNLYFYSALFVAALATFVAWRRARNPLRMWAANAETAHAREVDTALTRCFGTTTGTGVRALARQVREGRAGAPFTRCHHGPIAELLVAPNAFVSAIQNTPLEIYRVRERERVALQRLMSSFRLLEPAVSAGGANPTAAQREVIASKLEELAPDLDHERQAFEDLVSVARDQAGMF